MLGPGDLVEDFELPDQQGRPWRLSQALASGPVVVFFYPAAMTFGCTREACAFRDLGAEFAALGATRVGISADPVDKQRQFTERHGFDYPLLADPERRVAKAFGVVSGFKLGPVKRASFVIGPDRRVLAAFSAELRFSSHPERALEVLRRAQAAAP
ncbi:peroxiredoxin [Aciditerrimonas ferrireducens]|uniref:thioredoxin-dependent peroxiredoxin n=1 Tax=Aciditerrimonas ferrireducens TaxID=667306 RepID=A0ABV6C569_9ACTN